MLLEKKETKLFFSLFYLRDMFFTTQATREMGVSRKEKHYLYVSICFDAKPASQQKAFVN